MGWELTVECDAQAMRWLVRNSAQCNPRVVTVGEVLRLEWDGLESLGAELDNEVEAVAQQHLSQLSGLASVLLGRRVTLRLVDTSYRRLDGGRNVFVSIVDTMRVSATVEAELTVLGPDGQPKTVQSFDPIQKLQSLARSDEAAAKVLRLASGDLQDWGQLYRLYEVLEDAAGGTGVLAALTGVSRARLSLFTKTANSPKLTGDASRHGVQRGSAPAKAMPLPEAVQMLRHLSHAWLLHRASL